MLKKTALLGLCSLSAFAMHTAEVNLNNKDIEGSLRFDMGQFNPALAPETYMLGVRVLHGDDSHGDARDNDPLVEVNFLLQNSFRAVSGLTLGMGVKLDYTETGSQTYLAMPLGLEASYRLPGNLAVPLRLSSSLYYAPSSLAFDDADSYFEFRAGIDAEIVENGYIVAGYRTIDTDYDRADMNYNHSVYAGFRFAF